MPESPQLGLALAHSALGRELFPFELAKKGGKLTKTPLVRWTREATADEETIRGWAEEHPKALWGWRLPPGLIVADVDDEEAFAAIGLELPEAPMQKTPSGGRHLLYRGAGRQVVKEVDGLDTRVGGKGWVGLYAEDAFSGDPPEAPAWLLMPKAESAPVSDDTEPMETRGQLIAFAGAMRAGGMTGAEVYAILEHRLETGGIANKDPAWPWTREDLRTIAREAQKWAAGKPLEPPTIKMNGRAPASGVSNRHPSTPARHPKEVEVRLWGAQELLDEQLPELRWVIPGLLPEGTTVLAARPKIGKSWLAYQIAISVALGSTVLGQRASRGSSLYLALEDGPRRGQSRLRDILRQQGVRAVPDGLEVSFEWPRMGEGCEELITAWLDAHPDAVTVWVDTLARIRPKSTGRRNAYEVDYEDLGALQALVVSRGVGLGIVHHDRKAETDDFLESVSGTHGITGAADTIMVLKRQRNSSDATLDVTGRDIEERRIPLEKDGPIWVVSAKKTDGNPTEEAIVLALDELGESRPLQVAEHLGMDPGKVRQALKRMAEKEPPLAVKTDWGTYRPAFESPRVNLRRPQSDEEAPQSDGESDDALPEEPRTAPVQESVTSSLSNRKPSPSVTSRHSDSDKVTEVTKGHARAAADGRRKIIR